jgi:anti-anti-sigma regulatory factor
LDDFPIAMEGDTLTIRLPRTLTVFNRQGLMAALEACDTPFARVRLDAAGLGDVDAAGLGMLARVVRFTRDRTGERPLLRASSDVVRSLAGSAGLLQFFDLEPGA